MPVRIVAQQPFDNKPLLQFYSAELRRLFRTLFQAMSGRGPCPLFGRQLPRSEKPQGHYYASKASRPLTNELKNSKYPARHAARISATISRPFVWVFDAMKDIGICNLLFRLQSILRSILPPGLIP